MENHGKNNRRAQCIVLIWKCCVVFMWYLAEPMNLNKPISIFPLPNGNFRFHRNGKEGKNRMPNINISNNYNAIKWPSVLIKIVAVAVAEKPKIENW